MESDDNTLEANFGFIAKLDASDFIGSDALLQLVFIVSVVHCCIVRHSILEMTNKRTTFCATGLLRKS